MPGAKIAPTFGSGVRSSGQRSFALREPLGNSLDGGGEVAGFAKPEEEACDAKLSRAASAWPIAERLHVAITSI